MYFSSFTFWRRQIRPARYVLSPNYRRAPCGALFCGSEQVLHHGIHRVVGLELHPQAATHDGHGDDPHNRTGLPVEAGHLIITMDDGGTARGDLAFDGTVNSLLSFVYLCNLLKSRTFSQSRLWAFAHMFVCPLLCKMAFRPAMSGRALSKVRLAEVSYPARVAENYEERKRYPLCQLRRLTSMYISNLDALSKVR